MKFISYIIAVFFISIITCNAALASSPNPYLCRMIEKSLHKAGYDKDSVYRVDEIKVMLMKAGVNPPKLDFLDPTKSYRLAYNCTFTHGMAHPQLDVHSTDVVLPTDVVPSTDVALPTDAVPSTDVAPLTNAAPSTNDVVTTIRWRATN